MIPSERIEDGLVRLWHFGMNEGKGGWIRRQPVDAREMIRAGHAALDEPKSAEPKKEQSKAPVPPKPAPAPAPKPAAPPAQPKP